MGIYIRHMIDGYCLHRMKVRWSCIRCIPQTTHSCGLSSLSSVDAIFYDKATSWTDSMELSGIKIQIRQWLPLLDVVSRMNVIMMKIL